MLRVLHTHTEALIHKRCTQEREKSGLCREMPALGTKLPQRRMFKLGDKRGWGHVERRGEGERNPGKEK